MKNKKQNLYESINRILEIMGTLPTNNSIQEAVGPGPRGLSPLELWRATKSKAGEILNMIKEPNPREGGPNLPKINVGGQRATIDETLYDQIESLLTKEGDDLELAYNNFLRRGTKQEISKRVNFLARALGSDFANELYERMLINLQTKRPKDPNLPVSATNPLESAISSEQQIYTDLLRAKNKASQDGVPFNLKQQISTWITDPLQLEILYPKIEKKFKDYEMNPNKFTTEVPKPGVSSLKLKPDEQRRLNRLLGTTSTYWTNIFSTWSKTLEEIRTEIDGYCKGLLEDLKNVKPEEVESVTNAYTIKITSLLNKLKIRMQNEAIDELDKLGLPAEVVDKLKNNPDEFYKTWRENFFAKVEEFDPKLPRMPRKGEWGSAIAQGGKNLVKTVGAGAEMFIKAATNVFTTIFKFFVDLVKGKWKIAFGNLFDPRTNLGSFLYTDSWAGLNKMYGILIKRGWNNKRWFVGNAPLFVEATIWTNIAYVCGSIAVGIFNAVINLIIAPLWDAFMGIFCIPPIDLAGLCGKFTFNAYEDYLTKELWTSIVGEIGKSVTNQLGILFSTKDKNIAVEFAKALPGIGQMVGVLTATIPRGLEQLTGLYNGLSEKQRKPVKEFNDNLKELGPEDENFKPGQDTLEIEVPLPQMEMTPTGN